MKTAIYILSIVLLDAIVPRSCSEGRRPISDPIEEIAVIDEDCLGFVLYYEDTFTEDHTDWRFDVSADSAVLDVWRQDSLIYHKNMPFSEGKFRQLRDRTTACNLEYVVHNQVLSSDAPHRMTSLDVYRNNLYTMTYLYSEEATDTVCDFTGDIPALRKAFTDIFPNKFDGNTFIAE